MAELTKVRPAHLRREAWVYVRQSTMTQVRHNTESLNRQYELVERAHGLGWPADRVRVVDDDLGCSGAEATARAGFQGLVAAVGLGQVGLVLGIEVSRLARRNADWYHLLDLCAMTDTLIADADGLYHPGDYNDRLVLGLKGTMSEAELHVLRSRLDAGLRHKAARGELRQLPPVGLDYDDGRVVLSPDEAVRTAIAAVFDRFDELGSARQVVLSLRADGLRLPRRSAGARVIRWAEATYPAVHDLLTNPAYGGAFVFGRTKVSRQLDEAGRIVTRERELPRQEWEVTIPEHHPGYVSWQTYLANQDRLRANARPPRGQGGGAAREGRALLQGLVVCGKCGRRMLVGYSGPDGRVPRYLCAQGLRLYGSARSCQSLSGRRLDAAVVEEMFTVLQPAALAATAAALAEAEDQHARRVRAFELAVERARYEAERARRQFDAVEPENRLVARSLERDWEARLVTLRQAEADLAAQRSRRPAVLTEEEVAWLSRAGADLRAVFDADSTTVRERKQLLRLLISEVVITVDRDAAQAAVRIRWEGGTQTDIAVALPRRGVDSAIRTEADTLERIRRLAVHYDDATIARLLARQNVMTATGLPFTRDRVGSLRRKHGIAGPTERVGPAGDDVHMVSIAEAETLLGTSRATLYRWLASGFIRGEQHGPGGPWRIRIDAELRAKITPDAPEGWVGLEQAARRLGVAKQTVLDRIRRGELNAVHVNRGQRKGLAIQLPSQQDTLFAAMP